MNHSNSKALFERAQNFIPGGVNSPVRAFKAVGGTPIFFEKAQGARLTDADGNTYLDFVGSWGPMLLGHSHPKVIRAVKEAAERSTSFGAPTEIEITMAETIKRMVPGIEKVRMVNSGTEACMSAIRVARGFTGKDKIIKFEGCYHGHGDSFLIKAGSGAVTLGQPNSPGVTNGTAKDTLLAKYNDLESVEVLFKANQGQVAALIVEPLPGNMGCIPPQDGFLQGLRDLCDEYNAVLIFDEVMTGFRVAKGGASELYGVTADLVTLGKIVGAGLPVGAFGGKTDVMNAVAPVGPVYQAGTLSGNPLAMHAGVALLSEIEANADEIYPYLDDITGKMATGLREVFAQHGETVQINQVGSMISFHFTDQPVVDFETAQAADHAKFAKVFHGLLERGYYLPPSSYESMFLNTQLTESDIQGAVSAVNQTLGER
ncbi:MAG: glutamate-1-semialdehyde 2,1-aminomutase, partial [Bacteroidota bacterium]